MQQNAGEYSKEFVDALNGLYTVCTAPDKCILTISTDQYHSEADPKALSEYRKLSYYSTEKEKGFLPKGNILLEGRAAENNLGRFSKPFTEHIYDFDMHGWNMHIGDRIYINALGDVLLDPDLSYLNQTDENIGKYISQEELNRISGVGAFAFNTIYKLVWLRENRPELLEKAHAWLFISNLLAYKLTGIMATDRTMAGTSQLTDLETGDFSEFILNRLGLSRGLFPPHRGCRGNHWPPYAGSGRRDESPGPGGHSRYLRRARHPIRHFGSGADKNQPVLSSGTWEILMARSAQARLAREDYEDGATAEFDAESGLLNPGLQWLGSDIIEWVKAACFHGGIL